MVFPVPAAPTPQLVLNQEIIVPLPPEAVRLIEPPSFEQRLFLSTVIVVGIVDIAITEI